MITPATSRRPIGVAVVGFGWMGEVHTRAYSRVLHHFPDLSLRPELIVVADADAGRARSAASRYGFALATGEWSTALEDPRVAAVSVTAPNHLHRQIAVAVARAGKHLWIEKPVGLGVDDAAAIAAALADAGVRSAVGFNYRNAPAVQLARTLISSGELGSVTHGRVRLFSDYAADPDGALSWRFEQARGGDGVLGDLASHGVDLARHLLGEIDSVVADTATYIRQRPRPSGTTSHFAVATGGPLGDVENEDYVGCLMRMTTGARVVLEASRVSVGEQCNYGLEVHGTQGMLRWDFRQMGELEVSTGERYQDQSLRRIYAGPEHGSYAAFQPGAGIAMGYDDLKVIEAAEFLRSIDGHPSLVATIEDALASARVLQAMSRSVQSGGWEKAVP
ncbi:MAG: Gfo/Idh/MocA family oxidoreductase [Actinomycetota bacterium]